MRKCKHCGINIVDTAKGRPSCSDCKNERYKVWLDSTLEKRRVRQASCKQKVKAEMLREYGSKCVCCGETDLDLLTIDHIYDDGNIERRQINKSNIWFFLKKLGWPKDRYQLLCASCNFAKGYKGRCPHESARILYTRADGGL